MHYTKIALTRICKPVPAAGDVEAVRQQQGLQTSQIANVQG